MGLIITSGICCGKRVTSVEPSADNTRTEPESLGPETAFNHCKTCPIYLPYILSKLTLSLKKLMLKPIEWLMP